MWAGVAEGSLDAHIAGWLPLTHADYYKEFEGKFEDLGANLEGTKIGLVVPADTIWCKRLFPTWVSCYNLLSICSCICHVICIINKEDSGFC